MICCFGEVVSDSAESPQEPQMILNEFGKIADRQWYWLAEQYNYVVLHEFIVMPNHMHGIIEINRYAVGRDLVGTGRDVDVDVVGTGRDLSLRRSPPSLPKIKSLSELMGAYKTTVSKKIHLAGYPEFAWQRSFHDHIIRDREAYERISYYIRNNAQMWNRDEFFRMM